MSEEIRHKTDDYYQGKRPEMMAYVPAGAKRILDVGCGEGLFGAYLKDHLQAEVWGVEYEPDRAAVAAQRLTRVLSGDIGQRMAELPDGYFDLIICNDVLEHLLDPYTILEKFKKKLSPAGVVVSSIPNIRYFRNFLDLVFGKNWEYADHGIMDFTHFRFFTGKSIRNMFERAGYTILRHEAINPTKSIKVWPFVLLTFGYFNDIRYLQYATVARPKGAE